MNERGLRELIGVGFVVAHLVEILLLLGFYILGGLAFDEMTTAMGLIMPMFLAYTAAIVRYFRRFRGGIPAGLNLEPAYVFVTLAPAVLFALLVPVATMLKAFNLGFGSFEEYKGVLLLLEGVFGAYLGFTMPALFGSTPKAPQASNASAPTTDRSSGVGI